MNGIGIITICFIITTLPYRLLAYVPFYKRLRFNTYLSVGIFLFVNIVQIAGVYFLYSRGISYRNIEFMYAPMCMLLYLFLIDVSPFTLIFFYIFIMGILMIIRGISLYIYEVFINFNILNSDILTKSVVHLICFVIFCPFIVSILIKTTDRILDVYAPKIWRVMWILPFLSLIVVLMFTNDFSADAVRDWRFITARLMIIIDMALIYGVLLNSLKTVREQTILKETAKQSKHMSAIYINQYNQLNSHILDVRKAKHNLRQHLNLIQFYIDNEDHKALKQYIDEYGKTLPGDSSYAYSSNNAVNVVLSYYAERARERNIEYKANIQLPKNIDIPEPTLCVLFGNLLENAIEACEKCKYDSLFISVCSMIVGSSLSITVDNSCDKEFVVKDGVIMSDKHSGMGIGTYSVKCIADQYGGTACFEYKDKVFYASVLLNMD